MRKKKARKAAKKKRGRPPNTMVLKALMKRVEMLEGGSSPAENGLAERIEQVEQRLNRIEQSDYSRNRDDFARTVLKDFVESNPGLALPLT